MIVEKGNVNPIDLPFYFQFSSIMPATTASGPPPPLGPRAVCPLYIPTPLIGPVMGTGRLIDEYITGDHLFPCT